MSRVTRAAHGFMHVRLCDHSTPTADGLGDHADPGTGRASLTSIGGPTPWAVVTIDGSSRGQLGLALEDRRGEPQDRLQPQSRPLTVDGVPAVHDSDLILGQEIHDGCAVGLEQRAFTCSGQEVQRHWAVTDKTLQIPVLGA